MAHFAFIRVSGNVRFAMCTTYTCGYVYICKSQVASVIYTMDANARHLYSNVRNVAVCILAMYQISHASDILNSVTSTTFTSLNRNVHCGGKKLGHFEVDDVHDAYHECTSKCQSWPVPCGGIKIELPKLATLVGQQTVTFGMKLEMFTNTHTSSSPSECLLWNNGSHAVKPTDHAYKRPVTHISQRCRPHWKLGWANIDGVLSITFDEHKLRFMHRALLSECKAACRYIPYCAKNGFVYMYKDGSVHAGCYLAIAAMSNNNEPVTSYTMPKTLQATWHMYKLEASYDVDKCTVLEECQYGALLSATPAILPATDALSLTFSERGPGYMNKHVCSLYSSCVFPFNAHLKHDLSSALSISYTSLTNRMGPNGRAAKFNQRVAAICTRSREVQNKHGFVCEGSVHMYVASVEACREICMSGSARSTCLNFGFSYQAGLKRCVVPTTRNCGATLHGSIVYTVESFALPISDSLCVGQDTHSDKCLGGEFFDIATLACKPCGMYRWTPIRKRHCSPPASRTEWQLRDGGNALHRLAVTTAGVAACMDKCLDYTNDICVGYEFRSGGSCTLVLNKQTDSVALQTTAPQILYMFSWGCNNNFNCGFGTNVLDSIKNKCTADASAGSAPKVVCTNVTLPSRFSRALGSASDTRSSLLSLCYIDASRIPDEYCTNGLRRVLPQLDGLETFRFELVSLAGRTGAIYLMGPSMVLPSVLGLASNGVNTGPFHFANPVSLRNHLTVGMQETRLGRGLLSEHVLGLAYDWCAPGAEIMSRATCETVIGLLGYGAENNQNPCVSCVRSYCSLDVSGGQVRGIWNSVSGAWSSNTNFKPICAAPDKRSTVQSYVIGDKYCNRSYHSEIETIEECQKAGTQLEGLLGKNIVDASADMWTNTELLGNNFHVRRACSADPQLHWVEWTPSNGRIEHVNYAPICKGPVFVIWGAGRQCPAGHGIGSVEECKKAFRLLGRWPYRADIAAHDPSSQTAILGCSTDKYDKLYWNNDLYGNILSTHEHHMPICKSHKSISTSYQLDPPSDLPVLDGVMVSKMPSSTGRDGLYVTANDRVVSRAAHADECGAVITPVPHGSASWGDMRHSTYAHCSSNPDTPFDHVLSTEPGTFKPSILLDATGVIASSPDGELLVRKGHIEGRLASLVGKTKPLRILPSSGKKLILPVYATVDDDQKVTVHGISNNILSITKINNLADNYMVRITMSSCDPMSSPGGNMNNCQSSSGVFRCRLVAVYSAPNQALPISVAKDVSYASSDHGNEDILINVDSTKMQAQIKMEAGGKYVLFIEEVMGRCQDYYYKGQAQCDEPGHEIISLKDCEHAVACVGPGTNHVDQTKPIKHGGPRKGCTASLYPTDQNIAHFNPHGVYLSQGGDQLYFKAICRKPSVFNTPTNVDSDLSVYAGTCTTSPMHLMCFQKRFCPPSTHYMSVGDATNGHVPGICLARRVCPSGSASLILGSHTDTICVLPSNVIPKCGSLTEFTQRCKAPYKLGSDEYCKCVATQNTATGGPICGPGTYWHRIFKTFTPPTHAGPLQTKPVRDVWYSTSASGRPICKTCPFGSYTSDATTPHMMRACDTDEDCQKSNSASVPNATRCIEIERLYSQMAPGGCAGAGNPGGIADAILYRRNSWKASTDKTVDAMSMSTLFNVHSDVASLSEAKLKCERSYRCRVLGFIEANNQYILPTDSSETRHDTADVTHVRLVGSTLYSLVENEPTPGMECDTTNVYLGRGYGDMSTTLFACKTKCYSETQCPFLGYSYYSGTTDNTRQYRCKLSTSRLLYRASLCVDVVAENFDVSHIDSRAAWPCYECGAGKFTRFKGDPCIDWSYTNTTCASKHGTFTPGTTVTDSTCIIPDTYVPARYMPMCDGPNQYKKPATETHTTIPLQFAYNGNEYADPSLLIDTLGLHHGVSSVSQCAGQCLRKANCSGITFRSNTDAPVCKMYRQRWQYQRGYVAMETGQECLPEYEIESAAECKLALESALLFSGTVKTDFGQGIVYRRGCGYLPNRGEATWSTAVALPPGTKPALKDVQPLCVSDVINMPPGYMPIANPDIDQIFGVTSAYVPVTCAMKTACPPGYYAQYYNDNTRDNQCHICPPGTYTLAGVGLGAPRGTPFETKYTYEYDYGAWSNDYYNINKPACYPCASNNYPHAFTHETNTKGVTNLGLNGGRLQTRDSVRACCPTSTILGGCESKHGGRMIVTPYPNSPDAASHFTSACWGCQGCKPGYGVSWVRSLSSQNNMVSDICLPCQKNTYSLHDGNQAHRCERCPAEKPHTISVAANECKKCTNEYADPRKVETYEPLCDVLTPPGYFSVNRSIHIVGTYGDSVASTQGTILDGWKYRVYLAKVSLFYRQMIASYGGIDRVAPWLYGHYSRDSMAQVQGADTVEYGCPAGYGVYGLPGSNVISTWIWPAPGPNVTSQDARIQCTTHQDCGNAALYPSWITGSNGIAIPNIVIDHVCNGDAKSMTYCGQDNFCALCRSPRFVINAPGTESCMISAHDTNNLDPTDAQTRMVPDHGKCAKFGNAESDGAVVGASRRCSDATKTHYCDARTGFCTDCLPSSVDFKTTYTDDMAAAYQPCNQYGHCGSHRGNADIASCADMGTRLYCDRSETVPPSFVKVSPSVAKNYPGTCFPCPQFVRQLATLPFLGHSMCVQCASGYVSQAGAQKCSRCPDGFAPQATASDRQELAYTTCASCHSTGMGVVTFKMGTKPDLTTESDTDNSIPHKVCLKCNHVGMYSPGNGEPCQTCPLGRSSDGTGTRSNTPTGNFKCNICSWGYYGVFDAIAGVQCLACPAGTYAVDRAPSGVYQDPGTYLAAGTPDAHRQFCSMCPVGQSTNGQTGVIAADNNQIIKCTECAVGLVAEFPGSAYCGSCAQSYNNDEMVSVSGVCTLCSSGRSALPSNRVPPIQLHVAKGVYALALRQRKQRGTDVCMDCKPGYFRTNMATGESAGCQPCSPGRFAPNPGSASCLPCPPGKYSALAGAQRCTNCEVGKATGYDGVYTVMAQTSCKQDCIKERHYEWVQLLMGKTSVLRNLRATVRPGARSCCEQIALLPDGSQDVQNPWSPARCSNYDRTLKSGTAPGVTQLEDATSSLGSPTFKHLLLLITAGVVAALSFSGIRRSFFADQKNNRIVSYVNTVHFSKEKQEKEDSRHHEASIGFYRTTATTLRRARLMQV